MSIALIIGIAVTASIIIAIIIGTLHKMSVAWKYSKETDIIFKAEGINVLRGVVQAYMVGERIMINVNNWENVERELRRFLSLLKEHEASEVYRDVAPGIFQAAIQYSASLTSPPVLPKIAILKIWF